MNKNIKKNLNKSIEPIEYIQSFVVETNIACVNNANITMFVLYIF